jgi:glycosyltransferase involved in cell wall biosynthesis
MEEKNMQPLSWIIFADDRRAMTIREVLGIRMAETDPVVMVNPAISVARTHAIPSFVRRHVRINQEKDSWQYYPLHFPVKIPGLSSIAQNLNYRLLRRELNCLAPKSVFRIACYDSPMQYPLARSLGENLSVYIAIDDRTRTVWGTPIAGELEAEKLLLAKMDLVICISEFLAETLRKRMPAGSKTPIYVLPNGYDVHSYDPSRNLEKPKVLANVSKPTILLTGHISERIDWDGISAAVQACPEWTWLFVGPADNGIPEKIEALAKSSGGIPSSRSPRLIWKPPVPAEHVPALIAHCDVCAIPYRLNLFTLASCPLKGIEYLAMGALVFSTRIPALLRYGSAIQWVEEGNGESYAQALSALMKEKDNLGGFRNRCSAVSGDSYEDRTQQFRQIVLKEIRNMAS